MVMKNYTSISCLVTEKYDLMRTTNRCDDGGEKGSGIVPCRQIIAQSVVNDEEF